MVDEAQFRLLPVTIANTHAYHAQAHNEMPRAIRYARQVLDLLPANAHVQRETTASILALAYGANGDGWKRWQKRGNWGFC